MARVLSTRQMRISSAWPRNSLFSRYSKSCTEDQGQSWWSCTLGHSSSVFQWYRPRKYGDAVEVGCSGKIHATIDVYAASITFDRSNEVCQFFEWRWIQARSNGQSRQLGHSVFLISFFSLYQSLALRLPLLSSKDHPSRYWSSAACRPAVGKDASSSTS